MGSPKASPMLARTRASESGSTFMLSPSIVRIISVDRRFVTTGTIKMSPDSATPEEEGSSVASCDDRSQTPMDGRAAGRFTYP